MIDIPTCFGTIRMPHHRAEHCCNDCPFERHCDRIEALEAENERVREECAKVAEDARSTWMTAQAKHFSAEEFKRLMDAHIQAAETIAIAIRNMGRKAEQ